MKEIDEKTATEILAFFTTQFSESSDSISGAALRLAEMMDAAFEDEDFSLVMSIAETLAALTDLDEEFETAFTEYTRQKVGQRNAAKRTRRRPKTGAEKRKNKEIRRANKKDIAGKRLKKKKAKKMRRIKKARGLL